MFDIIPSVGRLVLPSDSRYREDIKALKEEPKESNLPEDLKEEVENFQRRDALLRKKAEEARAKNPGLKFVPKEFLEV